MTSRDPKLHPCFNPKSASGHGRVHLPVAPRCNISCNYCSRVFDCPNESRPGVASAVLLPKQALKYLHQVLAREPRISVVGIAGPGDPFANGGRVMKTLELIRGTYPGLLFCLSSNGLNLPRHLDRLGELGVSHLTVTMNSVDPAVGARIHPWVREGKVVFKGKQGAELLIQRQLEAIQGLKAQGIAVKVNTILIPGVNTHHVVEVSRTVAGLGADMQNLIPLKPTADTPFASFPEMDREAVTALRRDCGHHINQMTHCRRCRADAVGLLAQDRTSALRPALKACSAEPAQDLADPRPYVAVATREGRLVNLHLGKASRLQIWTATDKGFEIVEERETPLALSGDNRWTLLADLLSDCRAVLAQAAGENPKQALKARGTAVALASGLIEDGLREIFGAGNLKRLKGRKDGIAGGCRLGSGTLCG